MKKYTIKEFAEGKKAVKIENEEQWNKLNKVHKLTSDFRGSCFYDNEKTYFASWGSSKITEYDYEILEFSQLDFQDELVVGKWYKITNGKSLAIGEKPWYGKFQEINSNIVTCSEFINSNGKLGENGKFGTIGTYTFTLLTDLLQELLSFGDHQK